MTDIPDIEKALDRFHETAEQLAEIEHFEGRVPGCDYEPIFKGSVDLLDARSLIAALRDERDAAIADRAAQAERMARLEEAAKPFAEFAPVAKAYCRFNSFLPLEMQVRKTPTEDDAEAFDLKGRLTLEHFDDAARALSQEGSDAL